jgi:hypothetical protein
MISAYCSFAEASWVATRVFTFNATVCSTNSSHRAAGNPTSSNRSNTSTSQPILS